MRSRLDWLAGLGYLPADTSYFDQSQSLNTMGSGEFLTSLMYLSESELLDAGYDLNRGFAISATVPLS
jgi:hypothetical protein